MIKFFRKIRQNLLRENRISKYLLYAIGEIILVVIGILIALQINNWNEDRKLQKLEKSYYESIFSDLKLDSLEYQRKKYNAERNIKQLNNVIHFIDNDYKIENIKIDTLRGDGKIYVDTLALILSTSIAGFVQFPQTYENTISDLRSTGNIKLLKNEKLKNKLIDYYNYQKLLQSWTESLIIAREPVEQALNYILNPDERVAYNTEEGLTKDKIDYKQFVQKLQDHKEFKSLLIGMLHLQYRIIKQCKQNLQRYIIPMMNELKKEF